MHFSNYLITSPYFNCQIFIIIIMFKSKHIFYKCKIIGNEVMIILRKGGTREVNFIWHKIAATKCCTRKYIVIANV